VYAEPQRQWSWRLELPSAAAVADALRAAHELAASAEEPPPGVDWSASVVGMFGEIVTRDACWRDGDRIEIYRPLAADPRVGRRERVQRLRSTTRKRGE